MIQNTDLSYLPEPLLAYGSALLAEMLRLQSTGMKGESLWLAAASNLGNEDEKYCQFYICQECGAMYHGDFSDNSDPERDFCGLECEAAWLGDNPNAAYSGDLEREA